MPISVRIGDTLKREPTHTCHPNPKELIRKFREELERREENNGSVVRAEFVPKDVALVSDKQRRFIVEWCHQVPVLAFNCGNYDLNLIKEHFKELLASTTGKAQIEKKKANTTASASLTLSTIWARAPFKNVSMRKPGRK